jgi:hypothetical protein
MLASFAASEGRVREIGLISQHNELSATFGQRALTRSAQVCP